MSQLPPTPADGERELEPLEVDTRLPQPTRLYNYLIGGDDNFAVDRELAEFLRAAAPTVVDSARAAALALSAFMVRSVRYLAHEGIRQFLSAAAMIPTANNVHHVAQAVAPDSRVVYVGRDPVVLAHAHSLRTSTPQGGATAFVHGSVRRNPRRVLEQAAATLDFTEPVAIMLLETMNFVRDNDDAYGIVAELLDGLPSGSYLVISHTTNDILTEKVNEVAERFNETMKWPYVARSHEQISRFFDGLELVEGGVIHIDRWRRHENNPIPDAERLIPIYAGVGRKP